MSFPGARGRAGRASAPGSPGLCLTQGVFGGGFLPRVGAPGRWHLQIEQCGVVGVCGEEGWPSTHFVPEGGESGCTGTGASCIPRRSLASPRTKLLCSTPAPFSRVGVGSRPPRGLAESQCLGRAKSVPLPVAPGERTRFYRSPGQAGAGGPQLAVRPCARPGCPSPISAPGLPRRHLCHLLMRLLN